MIELSPVLFILYLCNLLRCVWLTGVQLKQQLDCVVIQVAAVQDDLDEGGQATLARCRHRYRPRHVQRAEHCEETHTHTQSITVVLKSIHTCTDLRELIAVTLCGHQRWVMQTQRHGHGQCLINREFFMSRSTCAATHSYSFHASTTVNC